MDPNDQADALLDKDGDGVSKINEYLSGTDPRDPQSFLRMNAISLSSGASILGFTAVAGKTYTILRRNSLDDGLGKMGERSRTVLGP